MKINRENGVIRLHKKDLPKGKREPRGKLITLARQDFDPELSPDGRGVRVESLGNVLYSVQRGDAVGSQVHTLRKLVRAAAIDRTVRVHRESRKIFKPEDYE